MAHLQIDDYNVWATDEYKGKFQLVNAWMNKDDEPQTKFCEVKKNKDGDTITVPFGMSGQFNTLQSLRNTLADFIVLIDEEIAEELGNGGKTKDNPF